MGLRLGRFCRLEMHWYRCNESNQVKENAARLGFHAWAAMIRPEARRRVRCYSDPRGEEGYGANVGQYSRNGMAGADY
jgi:hypothetical protein